MIKTNFVLVNSIGHSITDPVLLEVPTVPREGESIDLFGRNGKVQHVRHEYTKLNDTQVRIDIIVTVRAL
jgi:hypothetical protein